MENMQVSTKYLKTGEEYKESLGDNRTVYYKGELISDVTAHPATSGGIDIMAKIFDAQHEPKTQDKLTYIDPALGERVSKAWMIPRDACTALNITRPLSAISRSCADRGS